MTLDIIILAAGQGTRMRSRVPKVLHRLAGRPLLGHVLCMVAGLQARSVTVVIGHGAEAVEHATRDFAQRFLPALPLGFAHQAQQLGTGHAVQQAMHHLPPGEGGRVLVLCGDVPLLQQATVRALVQEAQGAEALALLSARLEDATGYGRIVRGGDGRVQRIVEQKDASAAERAITEIYSGSLLAPRAHLVRWLERLSPQNAQGEYYLTDIVALAHMDGLPVLAHCTEDAQQVVGVNSAAQLQQLERAHQLRQAQQLLERGVRLLDAARFDLRDAADHLAHLECAQDVEIDVGCIFQGHVCLGADVRIGAHCCIRNSSIAAGAEIAPYTHMDGAQVGENARIGPFARLRPGTRLGREVHIGNFVETKNSSLAAGAKANHLAYLGDAQVGERVNFGAGSITANYDGAHKHPTTIGDDVHIGSNCVLVAPVRIGSEGTVAAGSTVTGDTPPGTLTVARVRQSGVAHWKRPEKAAQAQRLKTSSRE